MPRILGLAAALLAASSASADLTPVDVLRKCDEARGNLGGVTWDVSVCAVEGGVTNNRTIHVQARSFDVLANTVAPSRRKGHKLIMVKGHMWFHKPDLSKPVPVSRRQKLMGRAANGDIASTNYAEDYEILSITNGAFNGEACHVFDLKARSGKSTYARIRYWASKPRLVGVKAEYYTTSGAKLIKSATMVYDNEVEIDGQERAFISAMTIRDELMSEDTTTLTFSEPELKPIPDRVFNLNLLRK